MKDSQRDTEIAEFVEDVRRTFPSAAKVTDEWCEERGVSYLEFPEFWVESFSDRTTEAIKAHDENATVSQLTYFSTKLDGASQAVRELIDVSYVESLMWDVTGTDIFKWGWRRVPSNLRQLYIDVWGEPDDV